MIYKFYVAWMGLNTNSCDPFHLLAAVHHEESTPDHLVGSALYWESFKILMKAFIRIEVLKFCVTYSMLRVQHRGTVCITI